MKEAAEFVLDYLVDDGHGHLVTEHLSLRRIVTGLRMG